MEWNNLTLYDLLITPTNYVGDTTYWRTCPETLKQLPVVNGIVRLVYPFTIKRIYGNAISARYGRAFRSKGWGGFTNIEVPNGY